MRQAVRPTDRTQMIAEFLESHLNAPFPPGAHELHLPDVDLEVLDAEVVGLAQSYLKSGRLAPEQREILVGCIADLRRIIAELPEEVRGYFARLHALAMVVLDERAVRGA
jgi:hypothetical protein